MSFLPETGTGVAGANSYASVEQADAYFQLRGNEQWEGLQLEEKQRALVNASDYMDLRWGSRYIGKRYSTTQGLLWPRILTTMPPVYPDTLIRACAEYAVRASANPLAPDLPLDESGRLASVTKEKVGPIEEETQWTGVNASAQSWIPYGVPDTMMRLLVNASSCGVIR